MYTIKQVSEKLKVSTNAIRFYEEKGMVKPKRNSSDYRNFTTEDISRLEMIILYRKMGFSLEAIKELLDSERDAVMLNQFATQYEILNQHVHTMSLVREVLGKNIELLLNQEGLSEEMLDNMEQTARLIAESNDWEDKWNFDGWAPNYDKDIRVTGEGLDFYANYDTVIQKTSGYVKGSKVVEIGIGTGTLAKSILDRGILPKNYIGIDQSVNMLQEAKKKCKEIGLRIGTFLQLPLCNNFCDTVVSSYAFHHCNQNEKKFAILEMDRILIKGGRIIIADLMFETNEARQKYEKTCTLRQKEELEDEFFGTVEEVEHILAQTGYRCTHEQIDELIWIITADKVE